MTGLDYHEDDIHNDDLDHYPLVVPQDLWLLRQSIVQQHHHPRPDALRGVHGDLGKHRALLRRLRPDTIELKNDNKMVSADSFDRWSTFLAPKATLAWTPGTGSARWLPSASFSLGQAFFTQDPRISVQGSLTGPTGTAALPSPFERSHSMQLVLEKEFSATDVRVTVGRTTTTETLGKIDPDNGTPFDLGPGNLKFLTANVRHQFSRLRKCASGLLQSRCAGVERVFFRSGWTGNSGWNPTVECPRTIFDGLVTLDKLPLGLHGRGEYEYVGHKILDAANSQNGWKNNSKPFPWGKPGWRWCARSWTAVWKWARTECWPAATPARPPRPSRLWPQARRGRWEMGFHTARRGRVRVAPRTTSTADQS
jgi:hypothetical protein